MEKLKMRSEAVNDNVVNESTRTAHKIVNRTFIVIDGGKSTNELKKLEHIETLAAMVKEYPVVLKALREIQKQNISIYSLEWRYKAALVYGEVGMVDGDEILHYHSQILSKIDKDMQ